MRDETPNVGHKFGELGLIELVATSIEGSDSCPWQGSAVALKMLERDLRVVPTVVEIDGGHISEPRREVGR